MAPHKHPPAPVKGWESNPKADRADHEHLRASVDFLTVLTSARAEFPDDRADIDALARDGLASLDATGLSPSELTASTRQIYSSRTLLTAALTARRKLRVIETSMQSSLASFARDNPAALGELEDLGLHDLRALHRVLREVTTRLIEVEPEFREDLLAKVFRNEPGIEVESMAGLARRLQEVRGVFATDRVRHLSQLDLLRRRDAPGTQHSSDLASAYASLWEASLAHQALVLCKQFHRSEELMGLGVHPELPLYQVPLTVAQTIQPVEVLSLTGVSAAEKETLLTLAGTDAYPTLESALAAARAL